METREGNGRIRTIKKYWSIPIHGWLGILLVAIIWPLNWLLSGLRTHHLFFLLWLGYCLIVDAVVFMRTGTSLLQRDRRRYMRLFLLSMPAWWLFELSNAWVQNWIYVGREFIPSWEYNLFSSLCFSTVMPAVLGTAELVSSFGWVKRVRPGPVIKPTLRVTTGFFIAGLTMLALLLVWPGYFFPFQWLWVFFILEPVNVWLGYRSLADGTQKGDWRPVLALCLGALICGLFWEMWNYYSYPKWVYFVPFVDFLHIFEMPLLGYGGYLPFGLNVAALYHFLAGLMGDKEGYIKLGS
ncbi:MAG: hypothetical protein AB1345_10335 [Chloroflexota bacterium]